MVVTEFRQSLNGFGISIVESSQPCAEIRKKTRKKEVDFSEEILENRLSQTITHYIREAL